MKEFSLFEDFSKDMEDIEDMENLSDDDENFSLPDSENMEDFSLFEDFIEGRRGRRKPRSLKSRRRSRRRRNKKRKLAKKFEKMKKAAQEAQLRRNIKIIKSTTNGINKTTDNINSKTLTELDKSNAYIKMLNEENKATLKQQILTYDTVKAPNNTIIPPSTFATREGYENTYSDKSNPNNIYYLTSIQNQNKSLRDNLTYLNGNYSSDNQKFLYEQQHITYWVAVNFWMFYIYVILAVIYGIIYFLYDGDSSLGIKILWYLHVFFYPYLIIYIEIALFLFLTYVYCWVVGQPFTVWKYFTSYPPII